MTKQSLWLTCPTCGNEFTLRRQLWRPDFQGLCPLCGCRYLLAGSRMEIQDPAARRPRTGKRG